MAKGKKNEEKKKGRGKRGKEEKEEKRKKGGKICPKKFLFKLNKGEEILNLPFFSPSSLGNKGKKGGRMSGIA